MKPEALREWEKNQATDAAHSATLKEYASLNRVGVKTTNVVKAIGILIKNGSYKWLAGGVPDWQMRLVENYTLLEKQHRIEKLVSHGFKESGQASGAKRKAVIKKEIAQLTERFLEAHPLRSKELPPVAAHTLANWDAEQNRTPDGEKKRFIKNRTAQIIRTNG
jgi:hypothetical protein